MSRKFWPSSITTGCIKVRKLIYRTQTGLYPWTQGIVLWLFFGQHSQHSFGLLIHLWTHKILGILLGWFQVLALEPLDTEKSELDILEPTYCLEPWTPCPDEMLVGANESHSISNWTSWTHWLNNHYGAYKHTEKGKLLSSSIDWHVGQWTPWWLIYCGLLLWFWFQMSCTPVGTSHQARGEIAKSRSSYTSRGETDTLEENEVETASPHRSQLAEAFWAPFNINPITNNREREVVQNR